MKVNKTIVLFFVIATGFFAGSIIYSLFLKKPSENKIVYINMTEDVTSDADTVNRDFLHDTWTSKAEANAQKVGVTFTKPCRVKVTQVKNNN